MTIGDSQQSSLKSYLLLLGRKLILNILKKSIEKSRTKNIEKLY